ncbi:hypothetical protein CK203_095434 [Vitis vinifera]|uniref:Retrotransposon gag domain-containing protein n=1 Tax=Vitis vinifera TaxID=29760 RepID=A0A438CW27_VITVI|nr:hypothetical protein CK203_095434 [Vitis vinifera]
MTSPSRSRSSARGDESYFEWRGSMERRQRENERQMQILLQETKRLREENNILRIRSSSQPQHYQRMQDPCHNQGVPLPREASPTLGAHEAWPSETPVHTRHVRRGESSGSTRVSSKRQREKRPKYLTQRARLGPQTPYKNRPHTAISLDAHSEPSSSPTLQGHAAHPLMVRVGKDRSHTTPPSSISRRLDDMLSTPFSPRIIKYEPPRGFIVPKFSTYDGSSDPFDHIMHYRQLMTLDIGNDMLLCQVFPASLQGQALSWFHRLPANSIDNFRDMSEVFVG